MNSEIRRKHILIVDDEPSVRMLVGRLLRDICPRCQVEEAADLPQARRKAMRSSPDLVILDLQMPGGSGTELCRFMQGHPWFYKTHILVITGYPTAQVRDQVFSQGVCEFLPKPFDLSDLAGSVRRLLA